MNRVSDAKTLEFLLKANVDEVRSASVWLESVCLDHGVPEEQIRRLDLCLNEALANIISHGGPGAHATPIQILFNVHHRASEKEAAVTVTDTGIEFDPLAHKAKPMPKTLLEAEPGGLGITMMENFSDAMSYSYGEGRNQVTFMVRWREEN